MSETRVPDLVIVQFVWQLKFLQRCLGNMFASVDINDTAKRCLRERGLPTQTLGRTVYWTKAYFYSAWLVIVVSSVVGLSQQLPPWIFYVVGSCFLIICIPMWFMLIVRERLGIVSCAQNISERELQASAWERLQGHPVHSEQRHEEAEEWFRSVVERDLWKRYPKDSRGNILPEPPISHTA